ERAAVLEEVVADRTRPQDAHHEGPRLGPVAARQLHADALPQQAARADQADAGQGQVAAQQGEAAAVLRPHLDGLAGLDAPLLPALGLGFLVRAVAADDLADGAADDALLPLLFLQARAEDADVVIAALAVAERPLGQGEHVAPGRLGQAGVAEFLSDLA